MSTALKLSNTEVAMVALVPGSAEHYEKQYRITNPGLALHFDHIRCARNALYGGVAVIGLGVAGTLVYEAGIKFGHEVVTAAGCVLTTIVAKKLYDVTTELRTTLNDRYVQLYRQ